MTITKKQRFYILNVAVYLIAYYYIFFGFSSDAGFLILSAPYMLLLLYYDGKFFGKRRVTLHAIIMSIIIVFGYSDIRNNFPLFYPIVGQTITAERDIVFSHSYRQMNRIKFWQRKTLTELSYSDKVEGIREFIFPKGGKLKIKKLLKTNHIFAVGRTYKYEVSSSAFKTLKKNIEEYKKRPSSIYDNTPPNNVFSYQDKDDFYIKVFRIDKESGFDISNITYPYHNNNWGKLHHIIKCSFFTRQCTPNFLSDNNNILSAMFYYLLIFSCFLVLFLMRNRSAKNLGVIK